MVRFDAPAQALATALQTAARAAGSERTGPPALTGVLLDATPGDPLRLTATDTAIAIRAELACDVKEAGRALVPAALLTDLVQRIPARETVSVAIDQQAEIAWGRSRFQLPTLNGAEFPALEFAGEQTVKIAGAALRDLVRSVAHATASRDDGRIFTTGIYLQAGSDGLIATATDNHRLAWGKAACTASSEAQALLPARALEDAVRTLPDDEIGVAFSGDQVCLRTGGVDVALRVLQATFPDARRVIDVPEVATAECDAQEALAAFERLAVLSNKEPRVNLRFEDDGAMVLSLANDVGQGLETLATDATGNPPELHLGPRYVVDALKALGQGKVRFLITGQESPMRIVRAGSDDLCMVVMPLRRQPSASAA